MELDTVLIARHDRVGCITLNRPQALNALNAALIDNINKALDAFERDPKIGCVLITGSAKAFAAGADVKEMVDQQFPHTYLEDFLGQWGRIAQRRKPIIAAVSGYALGGGFELALMCDFIIAADTARFGLPEVKLGVLPGAGGTQRLARLIGKTKAMEMVLTGRTMNAGEAERCGVVARVVAAPELLDSALETAQQIAEHSASAVLMLKECVNRIDEGSLNEGLRFERRMFQAVFATPDQKEGMEAFIDKRPPNFVTST